MSAEGIADLQGLVGRLASDGTCTDLTDAEPAAIVDLLALLVGTGAFVLHGTNRWGPIDQLEPRAAWDASRPSGRQKAVYATIDWLEALFNAILNRNLLLSTAGSIGIRYERQGARCVVAVNVRHGGRSCSKPDAWSPGIICVLRREDFTPSPQSDTEFTCPRAVRPIASLRVSPALSGLILAQPEPTSEARHSLD